MIEQPAKNFLNQLSVAALWIILFSCIGTAWGYSYLVKNGMIVSHPDVQVERIATEANNKNYAADPKTHMSFYGTGTPAAIIIGDSHAEAAATAVAAAAADRGSVVGITYSGCPTLADATLLESKRCGKFNRSLSEKLKAYPANVPVVIINRLTHYAEKRLVKFITGSLDDKQYLQQYAASIVKMACTLNREHPVVLVNPVPEMNVNVPRTLSHRLMTSKKAQDISIPLEEYQNRNRAILMAQSLAAKTCGVKVLDPTPYLCSAGRCMGSKNLEPHYFDDNHLSETGNKALVPMFRLIFTQHTP
ncbi:MULTISPECIES: SGNH hydrolase domain-containing protein [Enterobacter]|nr:SGNH hydrolase domain-containing protein [Enterobacter kobei]